MQTLKNKGLERLEKVDPAGLGKGMEYW